MLREVGTLARCIQSISDLKYRELNLQRGQFIFLTRICEYPGISLIELSQLLKVDKATTTKAVQKLMNERYVLKERNAVDKRGCRLFPAENAKKVYEFIIQEENRYIDICLADFKPEEKSVVIQLLKRMSSNIEQEWRSIKNIKENDR